MAITLDGTNGISTPDVEPTGSTVPTNGLYLPAANSVGIATNSSERVRVDSSGNVGIGTSSPAQKLDVNGGARFATSQWVQFGTNNTFYADSSYGLIIKAPATSNFIAFRSSNDTECMRITSAGGISFGSSGTAYGTSGQVLTSNGNSAPTWQTSTAATTGKAIAMAMVFGG